MILYESWRFSAFCLHMRYGVRAVSYTHLLYDHPVNKFVAGFIGSPQMNFFDVTLKGNEVTFEDGNKPVSYTHLELDKSVERINAKLERYTRK